MAAWFSSVLKFAQGKKTYILSALVILVTLILVATSKLTPENALVVLLFSLGLFAATFRSALAAHQQQTLAVLIEVGLLGKALAAKNLTAAVAAGTAAVQDGVQLNQDLQEPMTPVDGRVPVQPAGKVGI